MRWDLTGLLWDDYVAPRQPKEKIVRTPPDPVWLNDDYLPDLEQARNYKFDFMSDAELIQARVEKHNLIWDCELYPNYFLTGFKSYQTGKIVKFEFNAGEQLPFEDYAKILWIIRNFETVSFNGDTFDIPIINVLLQKKYSTAELADCASELIHGDTGFGTRPYQFYKNHKIKPIPMNDIDVIELTPGGPSLKISAGRAHAKRMADLPFKAGKRLLDDQKTILRWYWTNDLDNTAVLFKVHETAINLRRQLTDEYKVDVRSKSDPQIAEEVIRKEIQRITKRRIPNGEVRAGEKFKYRVPEYMAFTSPTMQWVLDFVRDQWFTIDNGGSPRMSEELAALAIPIGGSVYQMGIGGLHSKEKRTIHHSDDENELTDNDVTSYYPEMILKQGMYPPHVGPVFLQVFERIVKRRIAAKKNGDAATAETLKIVINGTFGKTAERGGFSVVYYPEMMIQVTLSGQLSILMLIEQLELNGISVVSANTDGIVIKCPRSKIELKAQIIDWWQRATGLNMESTPYKSIYSRDVNNYIAIYDKPKKGKDGDWFRYAKAIGAYRQTTDVYPLKWNPTCDVCAEAVIAFLATGTPIEQVVRECKDVRKFIEVRRVNGGACTPEGEYLGKAIRWYYATGVEDTLINASNGYNVPRSLGAKPCMILPDELPVDLNYEFYIERAHNMLADFYPKEKKKKAA